MKKKYTKKQIVEAIKHWQGVLKQMNENANSQTLYVIEGMVEADAPGGSCEYYQSWASHDYSIICTMLDKLGNYYEDFCNISKADIQHGIVKLKQAAKYRKDMHVDFNSYYVDGEPATAEQANAIDDEDLVDAFRSSISIYINPTEDKLNSKFDIVDDITSISDDDFYVLESNCKNNMAKKTIKHQKGILKK